MSYQKPFQSYSQLISLMERRGLECGDKSEALQIVERIGYFRLSAYTYPLRELLPETANRDTPYQFRSDQFQAGATLRHAVSLYEFDSKLRRVSLAALFELEKSLGAKIAHVLGEKSPMAHLQREYLDEALCGQLLQPDSSSSDKFDQWRSVYVKAYDAAKEQDFVRHLTMKYGSNLPIWAATEVLPFGGLVRILGLMTPVDKTLVAKYFGVSQGATLHKWLLAMNGLRNICAHSSRLFNRSLGYEIAIAKGTVASALHPVADNQQKKKLYVTLAVLQYLLKSRPVGTGWGIELRTQVRKFPTIRLSAASAPLVSPEENMGFPQNWDTEELWQQSAG